MQCPHCSATVAETAAFCPQCGASLQQPAGTDQAATTDGTLADIREQVSSLPGAGIVGGFMDRRRERKEQERREAEAHQAALDEARRRAFEVARQTCPLPIELGRIDLPGGLQLFNDEFIVEIAKDWGFTTKKLILTTHRLIHDKGLITKDQEVVNLSDIRNINYHKTMMMHGSIEIETGGENSLTGLPHAKDAKELRNKLLAMVNWSRTYMQMRTAAAMAAAGAPAAAPAPPIAAPVAPVPPSSDRYDQLKKLADLKSAGVLSDEEFEKEKAKILAQG